MELIKWYLIVVLVWGMGYLAMFPGVYATDAPYWYYEFSRTDIPILSQWLSVHAGAFYCFVEFGRRFFGRAVIGFGIFTFIQMSMVLYGIWKIAFFLNEKSGKYAAITSVIFFAIVPIHNILAVTSAQDSLFVLSFAMCLMHLIDIAMDAPRFFRNVNYCSSYVLSYFDNVVKYRVNSSIPYTYCLWFYYYCGNYCVFFGYDFINNSRKRAARIRV